MASQSCAWTPSHDMQVEPAEGPLKMEPGTQEPKVPCPHAAWALNLPPLSLAAWCLIKPQFPQL